MPELRIGNLRTRMPVIQGGMGVGISLSGLASAVASAGGIGVISSAGIGMLEPDFKTNLREANKRALRKEIQKARESTKGIIGVNIMVALTDYDDLVETSGDEGVDMLFIGAGLPLRFSKNLLPDKLKRMHTKIVPIVSSGRAAEIIFQYWGKKYNHVPDGIVVEGPLAGGHLGFKKEQITHSDYTLENLLPDVISVAKTYEHSFEKHIPVIAAGGIFTGADIHEYLQLGVHGVQLATRFVATHECDADIKFKQSYVQAEKDDLILIDSPVGLPGRAIRNTFLTDVSAGVKKPFKCPWKCLRTCNFQEAPYCIALALTHAKRGKLEDGFAFAGANAYRIDRIISVEELFETLLDEYKIASGTRD